MNDGQETLFHNQLIEANRALIALGTLNFRELNPDIASTVRDCLAAYVGLLRCQREMPLSVAESTGLQGVLRRLRAQLLYLGEDV